ncbi:hypothetical protein [Desulfobacter postgatei]|uniref:hypothetical protein n=1 Tax=Desulfobacter postgatei TaxID=2293 RepID=UPI00259B7BC3|nr:hypothetical protein [uncultured Desulfobacter sp.]
MITNKQAADFIISLILGHEKASYTFPVRSPSELYSIKAELENCIIKQTKSGNSPLPILKKWWDRHGKDKLNEHEKRHILLGFIDDYYSKKTPRMLEGEYYDLIVGKRFWDHLKYEAPKNQPYIIPKTSCDFFSRIRVVKKGQVQLHYPPEDAQPYSSKPLQSWNEFRVGLCTLSGCAHTKFSGTGVMQRPDINTNNGGIYGFLANTIEPEKDYKNELKATIGWAEKNNINLLLMPELSVCKNGRKILQNEIQSRNTSLYLIIPGSYHCEFSQSEKNVPQQYQNQAPVWWNLPSSSGKGEIRNSLPPYAKREPFHLKASKIKSLIPSLHNQATTNNCAFLQEHIELGTQFHLISTPLGIFGIAICKDMFNDEWFLKYRQLADHLCVISMNDAPEYFLGKALDCALHGTSCFYVNASQITNKINKPVETAIWTIPYLQNGRNTCYYNVPPTHIVERYKSKRIPKNGLVLVSGFTVKSYMKY